MGRRNPGGASHGEEASIKGGWPEPGKPVHRPGTAMDGPRDTRDPINIKLLVSTFRQDSPQPTLLQTTSISGLAV